MNVFKEGDGTGWWVKDLGETGTDIGRAGRFYMRQRFITYRLGFIIYHLSAFFGPSFPLQLFPVFPACGLGLRQLN